MSKLERMNKRKDALANIKKSPMINAVIVDLLDAELETIRERYEETSPASEFIRGQLVAIKSLRNEIGAK